MKLDRRRDTYRLLYMKCVSVPGSSGVGPIGEALGILWVRPQESGDEITAASLRNFFPLFNITHLLL